MTKRKENPMPMSEILKMANEIRLKKMAEARKKIFASGVKTCKKCNVSKPFSEYAALSTEKNSGRSQTYCKQCNADYNKNRLIHAAENVTDWYIKDFGRRHYGMKMKDYFSPELLGALKQEILARRAAKSMLEIDGKTFASLNKFAMYVQGKYGISHHAVKARMYHGHPAEHAILSNLQTRQMFTGGAQKLKAINVRTGEEHYFISLRKAARTLHIGEAMLTECLKSGKPTRLYHNSKTNNTYKIYKDGEGKSINNELQRAFNRPSKSTGRTESCAI